MVPAISRSAKGKVVAVHDLRGWNRHMTTRSTSPALLGSRGREKTHNRDIVIFFFAAAGDFSLSTSFLSNFPDLSGFGVEAALVRVQSAEHEGRRVIGSS